MNITIVATNGEQVQAPAERWLCGLIALLPAKELERLCVLVASRLDLDACPQGHIIGVPGIISTEHVNGC